MAVPVNKALAQSPHTWGRYSSLAPHASLARLLAKPHNLLRRACWRYMREKGMSFEAFARLVGVPGPTLRTWYSDDKRTTSCDVLGKLAVVLEITQERAIDLAGSVTSEQRRLEQMASPEMAKPCFS